MNFQDYIRYDAVGLAELIRKKEVSADEVLQAALNRLDEVNPKLNLLAHDLRERAAAWQGSSENADTPLAGVPFLLKPKPAPCMLARCRPKTVLQAA